MGLAHVSEQSFHEKMFAITALCTLVSFSASCETGTFNPWLSPTQVEVEEQCDVFTGRVIADVVAQPEMER